MAGRGGGDGRGFTELRKELAAKEFAPVYALVGEDQLRAQSVVEWLRKNLLGDANAAFNYHVFDGEDCGADRVLQQALSYPMLAAQQLVWVKRADAMLGDAAAEEAICRYFNKPPAETLLILTSDKADGRKRWVKAAKAAGYWVDMATPSGRDLTSWVERAGRERGLALTQDLAVLLVELVGEDLQALSSELDKLGTAVGDDAAGLDEQALQELILEQRPVDPFVLVGSLGPGRAAEGIRTLRRFLAEGRTVFELTPLLIWRIKQVAQVASLLDEGLDTRQIPSALGASPYAVRQASDVARNWGRERVDLAMAAVARVERTLKSSPLGGELVLERAILEICAS